MGTDNEFRDAHGTDANLGDYLADLWHGADPACNENVKVRHEAFGDSRYLRLLCRDGRPSEAEFLRLAAGAGDMDAYFHPNTVVPCGRRSGKAGKAATFKVYAFAIDVDPIRGRGGTAAGLPWGRTPMDVAMALLYGCLDAEGLPWPNYVEHGRNFRLIYILDEPVYARSAKGRDILKKVGRFQRHVADAINRYDGRMHASPQGYETGFRIPGTRNGKNAATVRVRKVRERFLPFCELFDHLPPAMTKAEFQERKNAVAECRRRQKNAAGKSSRTRAYDTWCRVRAWSSHEAPDGGWPKAASGVKLTVAAMLLRRLVALRMARTLPGILREVTAFTYLATWENLFGAPDDALAVVSEFNEGFDAPLPQSELRQKLPRLYGSYHFSNRWIVEHTGIPEGYLEETGPGSAWKPPVTRAEDARNAAKCRLEAQPKAGTYRARTGVEADAGRRHGRKPVEGDFDACFEAGMGARAVAERIGCSVRTAYRRLAAWAAGAKRRETGRTMAEARAGAARAEADGRGIGGSVPRFGIRWDCREMHEETDWKGVAALRRVMSACGRAAPA